MRAIRIENLRSIRDSTTIEFKPLTILIGRNSSGKSTFLRTLPLLRQSVETPTATPILWYGRYVDFGSFQDSLCEHATTPHIAFEFTGRLRTALLDKEGRKGSEATIRLELAENNNETSARRISISLSRLPDFPLVATFRPNGEVERIQAGNRDISIKNTTRVPSHILPVFLTNYDEPRYSRVEYLPYSSDSARFGPRPILRFHNRNNRDLEHLLRKLTQSEDLPADLYLSRWVSFNLSIESINSLIQTTSKLHKSNPSRLSDEEWESLRFHIFADQIFDLLVQADFSLAEFASSVTYLGPARAPAKRYYRIQELAVREVDFRGENLAMFLASLKEHEKKELSEFSRTHFGIEYKAIPRAPGHTELHLTDGLTSKNLADLGFGYSQLLPVIAQTWKASRDSNHTTRIIAIEQPELHLHPAFQSRLADMFVGILSQPNSASRLSFVIETHSEQIINRIGCLIAENRLNPLDVQILLFADDGKISRATYRDDGSLENWPYGFFEGKLHAP